MIDVLLVFPRARYPSGDPPLGVAYLAACLRQAGHSVAIFDATFANKPWDELTQVLREQKPRLVAISALTSMLAETLHTARLVKEVLPETVVIVGGPHATVEPQATAAMVGVDAVAVGEGEISLPALLERNLDFHDLPGFGWMEGDEYRSAGPSPVVANLDDIPYPAWDLLPMRRYLQLWYQLDAVAYGLTGTSIIASRGCPFDCSYCQPTLRTIFGSRVRRRSPDNITGELHELKRRFKIDGVMWLDDTFLLDRKWVAELCGEMIEAKLGLVWGANIRADTADRESLEIMYQAGLRVVNVGIESATQRILDEIYQKRITLEQVRETVAQSREVGLKVRGYFMLGAPTETEQEAWDTVRLADELPLDDATFSITTPLPHTHLWDKTRDLVSRPLDEFDYYKVPVYSAGNVIPPARLNRIKRLAYLRFYLGRRRLWRTVRSVLSVSGLRKTLVKVQRW